MSTLGKVTANILAHILTFWKIGLQLHDGLVSEDSSFESHLPLYSPFPLLSFSPPSTLKLLTANILTNRPSHFERLAYKHMMVWFLRVNIQESHLPLAFLWAFFLSSAPSHTTREGNGEQGTSQEREKRKGRAAQPSSKWFAGPRQEWRSIMWYSKIS